MPLYEYECDNCQHRFEVIQKFSDAPPAACPKCGGPVQKLASSPAIQFKGSGFYITDYARAGKSDEGKASRGDSGTSSESKSDSSGETKSETKTESAKSDTKSESKGESKGESKSKSESKGDSKPASTPSTS